MSASPGSSRPTAMPTSRWSSASPRRSADRLARSASHRMLEGIASPHEVGVHRNHGDQSQQDHEHYPEHGPTPCQTGNDHCRARGDEDPATEPMGLIPGEIARERPGRSDAKEEIATRLAKIIADYDQQSSNQERGNGDDIGRVTNRGEHDQQLGAGQYHDDSDPGSQIG